MFSVNEPPANVSGNCVAHDPPKMTAPGPEVVNEVIDERFVSRLPYKPTVKFAFATFSTTSPVGKVRLPFNFKLTALAALESNNKLPPPKITGLYNVREVESIASVTPVPMVSVPVPTGPLVNKAAP